jgi:hypothetical protein
MQDIGNASTDMGKVLDSMRGLANIMCAYSMCQNDIT